ncbi:unnamed protein product [Gordionus sp. m RMFG-2023]
MNNNRKQESSYTTSSIFPTLSTAGSYNLSHSSHCREEIGRILYLGIPIFSIILCMICGNLLVVISVLAFKNLKSIRTGIIASLALADLLVAITVLPFAAIDLICQKWIFPAAYCNFYVMLDFISCQSSIFHICLIAVEQYIVISSPLRFIQIRKTLRCLVIVAICGIWTLSIVIAYYFTHYVGRYNGNRVDLESLKHYLKHGHPHNGMNNNYEQSYQAIMSNYLSRSGENMKYISSAYPYNVMGGGSGFHVVPLMRRRQLHVHHYSYPNNYYEYPTWMGGGNGVVDDNILVTDKHHPFPKLSPATYSNFTSLPFTSHMRPLSLGHQNCLYLSRLSPTFASIVFLAGFLLPMSVTMWVYWKIYGIATYHLNAMINQYQSTLSNVNLAAHQSMSLQSKRDTKNKRSRKSVSFLNSPTVHNYENCENDNNVLAKRSTVDHGSIWNIKPELQKYQPWVFFAYLCRWFKRRNFINDNVTSSKSKSSACLNNPLYTKSLSSRICHNLYNIRNESYLLSLDSLFLNAKTSLQGDSRNFEQANNFHARNHSHTSIVVERELLSCIAEQFIKAWVFITKRSCRNGNAVGTTKNPSRYKRAYNKSGSFILTENIMCEENEENGYRDTGFRIWSGPCHLNQDEDRSKIPETYLDKRKSVAHLILDNSLEAPNRPIKSAMRMNNKNDGDIEAYRESRKAVDTNCIHPEIVPNDICKARTNKDRRRSLSISTSSHCSTRVKMKRESVYAHIQSNRDLLSKEKKAIKTLGIILGAFLVCWTPYFFAFIIHPFCNYCIPVKLFVAVTWLGYLNSALNPIIYAVYNKRFRKAFKALITCRFDRERTFETERS